MWRLRKYYDETSFQSDQEEIHFFKKVKPQVASELLFHIETFEYYRTAPKGSESSRKQHIIELMDRTARYLSKHCDLHSYITLGYQHLDEIYFLRQEYDPLAHGKLDLPSDPNFSSPADTTVSKLLYKDRFIQFLKNELHNLEHSKANTPVEYQGNLEWLKSKTDLVELIYGLYSSGSIKGELKNVIASMEQLFNIDLGNFYRTYTDIKYKKNPTSYIDEIKSSLQRKISEENQKT